MNAKYIINRLSISPKCKLITPNTLLVQIHGTITKKKTVQQIWCVVDDSGVPE
jgi:hypothetical protein